MRILISIIFFLAPLTAAVDLVTLPRRDSTQLTIYNSVDLTMVKESRALTVREGLNRIQFSWSGTLIDPTSIEFRILSRQSQVDLRETTYPKDRREALQWNIYSEVAGPVQIEIRYFTSGVTWNANYSGIADQSEQELDLKGYVRVVNNSGEEYDNAQVRLVVGKINLVEKIVDLARGNLPPAPRSSTGIYQKMKKQARREVRARFSAVMEEAEAVMDMAAEAPKEVKKQGLSEYFLFTIQGRETVRNNEPVQLLALDVKGAPLEPIYRCSDRTGGGHFDKFYRVKNVELDDSDLADMNNLGLAPIPDGQVMLYSEYKNSDLAFVGSSHTKYVPIGERLESSLGRDQDLSVLRKMMNRTTTDIVLRQYKRRLDDEWVQYYDRVDYNLNESRQEEIVNGKDKTIKCEIERRFNGEVLLKTHDKTPKGWEEDRTGIYIDFSAYEGYVEKVDSNHIKIHLDLKPGEKRLIDYVVTNKIRKAGPDLHTNRIRERK